LARSSTRSRPEPRSVKPVRPRSSIARHLYRTGFMQYQTTGAGERRASRRKSLNLAARLVYQGSAALPCRIADFCADGVFVRYALAVGEALEAKQFQLQDVVQL